MFVGYFFKHISAQPLPKLDHAPGMTGWAKMASPAGKGQQIFMIAVAALYPGKSAMKDATIKVLIYYFFYMGS